MKPSLTNALCTRCGLCCDGSLFADVELAHGDEAAALEVMGLEIEEADGDDGGLLLQPCRALKGKRCSIYAHRPDCCRTFECGMLQDVKRGVLDVARAHEIVAEALKQIKRVKVMAVQLGARSGSLPLKERCEAALAHSAEVASSPEANRRQAELRRAMLSVERLTQTTFLGGRNGVNSR